MRYGVPQRLRLNAWDSRPAEGDTDHSALAWTLRDRLLRGPNYLLPTAPKFNDWRDPRVGWGIIVPEPPGDHGLSPVELESVEDQPASIQRLVQARTIGGVRPPVFRFRSDRAEAFSALHHYRSGRRRSINGSGIGTGSAEIPYYLLIYGSPVEVPWALQYVLNTRFCVGRLDLSEAEGLKHYIDALLADSWPAPARDWRRTVTWAVDHGPEDITSLMRTAIADKLAGSYRDDSDLKSGATFVDGAATNATTARLIEELRPVIGTRGAPSLIVTTSHGLTDSSLSADVQRTALGLPVGQDGGPLKINDLLAEWEPNGAIWYAHACCSAGSSDISFFEGLVTPDSDAARVLRTVTEFAKAAGAMVSPLPRRLLGRECPIQAFVGHVEPTFDWTLRSTTTGQYLTDGITYALYTGLFSGCTIGHALRRWYQRAGAMAIEYAQHRPAFATEDTAGRLLALQLGQRDIVSLVILGDPTARLDLPAQ